MKKAFIQLHIAVFLAGFTAIFGKLILLGEGFLVWWRLLITVVVLLGWMRWKKQLIRLPWRLVKRIAIVGAILAMHWLFFYGAVKYANVSVALVCLSATGFFTAFTEPLILRRQMQWWEFFLGTMAIAGIYIIFDFHPQYKQGIAFGLLAALGSALFPVLNKQLLDEVKPRVLTLYELGSGFLFLSCFLPLYQHFFPAAYFMPTLSDWTWLIVLSVACTVLPFDLQLKALQKISAFTANLTYNLEPIYGIILALIFFDEGRMLHWEFFAGLALILCAISLQMIVMRWKLKKERASLHP